MDETKPIYASKSIIGSLIALLAIVFKLIGIDVAPADLASANDAILGGIGVIGTLLGIYGRITATKKIE